MTLFRMIVVLVCGLVLLLAVVVLRAETTRLHYEISQCEQEAYELRRQLHEAELERARLRNPTRIRTMAELVMERLRGPQGSSGGSADNTRR
jgi:cell division protein FtsL